MTDPEKFRKTFDHLHASADTLTEVLEMTNEQKKVHRYSKPLILIAAAAALVLALGAGAYAADWFGFRALLLDNTVNIDGTEYAVISLTQPQAVPEEVGQETVDWVEASAQAMEEWQSWKQEWEKDHPFDMDYQSKYEFNYNVYSDEEEAKLEEIAAKYGLALRNEIHFAWSSETTGQTGEQFFTNAELAAKTAEMGCSENLFYETPAGFDKVYWFGEGTFCVSYYLDAPSSGESLICYCYNSMYRTFSSGHEVEDWERDIDSYRARTHVCPDGTEVTILSNGSNAYIYVYLDNSFFTEHIHAVNTPDLTLTDADLDYIADYLNYSVIGK